MMSRTREVHRLKILATTVGAALVVLGLLLAFASSPAWAAQITVNSLEDDADGLDGECTLREAITSANTDPTSVPAAGECANGSADDIITFDLPGSAPWTVNLTAALPVLSTNIDIQGPGADQLTVRRNSTNAFGIFTVTGDTTVVAISGMTISNGSRELGGGIYNEGDLTVSGSTISGNSAEIDGGGIYNIGTLTVTDDSTISDNTAEGSSNGSFGGGITNWGTLTVSGSTISGNTATGGTDPGSFGGQGGGIFNGARSAGTMKVTDSTISDNSATAGQPDVGETVGFGGRGGGILNRSKLATCGTPGSESITTITNTTISGNSAAGIDARGGGVYNEDGPTVIEHSTITLNTAPDGRGSGVASFGDTCTPTTVLSSIISANQGTDVDFVVGTTNSFDSNGYNLIGDGNATAAFNQTGDQRGVTDPGLDPLDSYGGPTQTHRLQSDSPAIDAVPQGTNDCGTVIATDQRGVSRPQGSACDIGSFELEKTDTGAPKVISTFPRNGGEVGPAANIRATFSEDMREASVINAFKLFRKGSTNQIAAQVTYDAATDPDIATLNPTNNLRRGVTYKAVVTTVAKDVDGNRLDQDQDPSNGLKQKSWTFTIRN
jgi:CSLREA domain-containing protein